MWSFLQVRQFQRLFIEIQPVPLAPLPSLRHLSASELLSYQQASSPLPNTVQNHAVTYKTLATCQPSYLYNRLQVHQPSRALCSSIQKLQAYVTRPLTSVGAPYSSPATWNSIPTSIKIVHPTMRNASGIGTVRSLRTWLWANTTFHRTHF